MRSRYRMFMHHTWQEIDQESAATIDGAISRACELSTTRGAVAVVDHDVAVRDTSGKYGGARGVAERGKWRWVKPCSKCIGSGAVRVSKHVLQGCAACEQRGWRVAIE